MITCSSREYAFEYIQQVLEKIPVGKPMYFVEYIGNGGRGFEEYMVSRTVEEMLTYVQDEMLIDSEFARGEFDSVEAYHAYLTNSVDEFEVWCYWREEDSREIARLKALSFEKVWDSYGEIFRERVQLKVTDRGLAVVD